MDLMWLFNFFNFFFSFIHLMKSVSFNSRDCGALARATIHFKMTNANNAISCLVHFHFPSVLQPFGYFQHHWKLIAVWVWVCVCVCCWCCHFTQFRTNQFMSNMDCPVENACWHFMLGVHQHRMIDRKNTVPNKYQHTACTTRIWSEPSAGWTPSVCVRAYEAKCGKGNSKVFPKLNVFTWRNWTPLNNNNILTDSFHSDKCGATVTQKAHRMVFVGSNRRKTEIQLKYSLNGCGTLVRD